MAPESETWSHESVMVARVLELLKPSPGIQVLEGFMGVGGHSRLILEMIGETGHLWGFELDPKVAEVAEERLGAYAGRFTIFRDNCRYFNRYLEEAGVPKVDAAFNDLGIGRYHLGAAYGMSFKKDLPLDFRLSPELDMATGAEIIEGAPEAELRKLISGSGQRRFAGRIAAAIIRSRPVGTTGKLARIIEDAVPRKYHKPGTSPAQRVFAHIRAVVNDEAGALAEMMSKLPYWLKRGGRAVFLCYTSDEFSRVRKHLKGTGCTCPDTAPRCTCGRGYRYRILADGERPEADEVERNPSARSARLAAAELVYGPGEGPAG
jgi:16S rRNA (cytosine1402-N4)-methyltransferase